MCEPWRPIVKPDKTTRRSVLRLGENAPMLTETEGRLVLRKAFQDRGYQIVEDVSFTLGEATIILDGYDVAARVGYEYLSAEDGLSDELIESLDLLMESGQHFIFLIDEHQVDDPQALLEAAQNFLIELEKRR